MTFDTAADISEQTPELLAPSSASLLLWLELYSVRIALGIIPYIWRRNQQVSLESSHSQDDS